MKTTYQKEKLRTADKALRKAINLSEMFCPTDAWMTPLRAAKANESWHRMRDAMQDLGLAIAKEMKDWPDEG